MTRVIITIPDRTIPGPVDERVELTLNRCKLVACQQVLPPGKEYCDDVHRWAFHNQLKKDKA
jgi:hypothetical protein